MVKSVALRGAEGNLTPHRSGNNRAKSKMGRELEGAQGMGLGEATLLP